MRDNEISPLLLLTLGLGAGSGVDGLEEETGDYHMVGGINTSVATSTDPEVATRKRIIMHGKQNMSNLALVKYMRAIRNTPRSVVCNGSLFASSLIYASSAIPMSKYHPRRCRLV